MQQLRRTRVSAINLGEVTVPFTTELFGEAELAEEPVRDTTSAAAAAMEAWLLRAWVRAAMVLNNGETEGLRSALQLQERQQQLCGDLRSG